MGLYVETFHGTSLPNNQLTPFPRLRGKGVELSSTDRGLDL